MVVSSHMNELHESIWSVLGSEAGKIITIVGGTHGNERTGVEVVLKLQQMIAANVLKIEGGTCNLILGNPRAIEINERGSGNSHDLNRSYPTDLLSREPDRTYENARARMIAPFLAKSDVVVDLHSTNKPSEPFLACLHTAQHEAVYRWFTCDKVLSDSSFVMGGASVTTDEYTEAHGGIGICYETGQASDTSRVDEVIENILQLMADLKLIVHEIEPAPTCEREVFELVESIILTADGFRFAEGLGNHSWEPFHAGNVIGYHGEHALVMSYEGMIVFPKPHTRWQEGRAVGYIARRVD